jgi:hypothetical protein
MKLRLSRPVLRYLEGGSLWAAPDDLEHHGYGEAGRSMQAKVVAARHRSDGSVSVELTADEAVELADLADSMADASSGDAGWDPSARGDLNAARALLRHLREGASR